MAKSKNATQKKTETKPTGELVESVAVPQRKTTPKPRLASAIRRPAVQYTPRIPTARCPWC